ncbi:MAG: hypothetical protein N2039_01170 [Gemmataceae bacterium]|nr:hypothetical protein [Gemmataceae bacterium]
MEVVALIVVLFIAFWIWQSGYASGKREGSRKGYGVGYSRGRRASNASGCLVVLLVLGFVTLGSVAAVACSLNR